MLHLVFYCPPFSPCSPNTHELAAKLRFTGSANIDLTFWSHVCILVLWRFCQKWNNFFFQESNRSSSRKVPRLSHRLLLKSKQGLVFGLMMPRSAGNEKYCLTGTQTNDTCLRGNTSTLRFYCCFFVWQFQNHKDARCGFYSANRQLIFYFLRSKWTVI